MWLVSYGTIPLAELDFAPLRAPAMCGPGPLPGPTEPGPPLLVIRRLPVKGGFCQAFVRATPGLLHEFTGSEGKWKDHGRLANGADVVSEVCHAL